MIYGTGIDLVACDEFAEVLQQEKSQFLQLTFTGDELEKCKKWQKLNRRAQCLGVRYAAKEACLKALDGERLSSRPNHKFVYRECEVRSDSEGRPFLFFHGSLQEYLQKHGIRKSHLTMSHIAQYAIAYVILEHA